MKTIQTARLMMRDFKESDAKALFAYLHAPKGRPSGQGVLVVKDDTLPSAFLTG